MFQVIAPLLIVGGACYFYKRNKEQERERNVEFEQKFNEWPKRDKELLDRMYPPEGGVLETAGTIAEIRAKMQENDDALDEFNNS